MTPCEGLAAKGWLFWRDNSLILTPHSKDIAPYLSLNYNSRVYFLNSNLSLYEIYKYQRSDKEFVQQKIGEVTSSDIAKEPTYIWERRSNLSSIHLDIVYATYQPLLVNENNNALAIKGLYADIFFALHQEMGFKYSLHAQEGNVWGFLLGNGSYSGLFGQIQSGKMVWSITDTTMTLERSQTFDFSIPILNQRWKLVTRRPPEGLDTISYFRVFSTQFWIALLVSLVVLISIMYWILRLDPISDNFQSNRLKAAMSFTLSALFCREIVTLNISCSGKILSLAVVFWGFLITVSYNAILTSVLVSPSIVSPINSLEELLLSKEYTLIWNVEGPIGNFFKKSPANSTSKFGYNFLFRLINNLLNRLYFYHPKQSKNNLGNLPMLFLKKNTYLMNELLKLETVCL